MLRTRARVDRGRLVIDEPIDLPQGTEVEVIVVDEDSWPAELDEVLADRAREADRGELYSAEDVIARLRGR